MGRGPPRPQPALGGGPRGAGPVELLLVIVDASASTRRNSALSQAKGLLSQVFDDAYRRRARLALLTASGTAPQWQHQGLKASAALQPWLAALGAGGGTPLQQALEQAAHWLAQRKKRYPAERQRVLVMTDGRLKPMSGLAPLPCESMLVDIEMGPIRLGRARELAQTLGAEYRHIENLALSRSR
ncbi:VWA domain-containing protein [Pseudomonas sp. v388]|nr:VWA domain-containing protein [Pseudomonas sp. v388]